MLNKTGISVKTDGIRRTFDNGKVLALDGVSLEFSAGSLHGIIGPAGAGKTTLIRIMLSLMEKDAGQVSYFDNGTPVEFSMVMPTAAYMPEQQSLYADLSIREHLRFFASMYGINKETYTSKTTELLDMTRLGKFLDRPAGKLSGGMYKKLGLMCALLRSPRIIFLDEPTNGVDPISRREFWEILNDAAKNNITVVMTTAYMDEAERCEHVHLMENGHVIDCGEPRTLLETEGVDSFDEFFIKRSGYHAEVLRHE